MPYLHRVTHDELRGMAKQATSMYMDGGTALEDAVIKVASSFEHPLTSEHIRRVCEMTYHDAFERGFSKMAGQDRVVNFDPPNAEKVAAAVQAQQIESFQDKVAAARAPVQDGAQEKTASVAVTISEPDNAFLTAMGKYASTGEAEKMEARHILKDTLTDVKEAARYLEVEIGSLKTASYHAYLDLGREVRQEVIEGTPPVLVLESVAHFMKQANVAEPIIGEVIQELTNDMVEAGVPFDTKVAGLDHWFANESHPLRVRSVKVGELRGQKFAAELALDDIRGSRSTVELELKNALFQ
jgi:hypothetical protein